MKGFDVSGLKGNYLKPLAKDDLERIHFGSLEVLEQTGIKVYEPETLRILERGGCEVERDKGIVKLPQYLVTESISKAPSVVTLCGRNKKFDVRIGDGKVHIGISGSMLYIYDLATGERRKAVTEDTKDLTRVADALSNIHQVGIPLCIPSDVSEKFIDIYGAAAAIGNTEKNMYTVVYNEDLIDFVLEMLIVVAGGEEELIKRPLASCLSQPVSPLMQIETQTKLLRAYAEKGLPVLVCSNPTAGLTSPVSLAGQLVLANADSLSSLVIAQLINPKTPIILGTALSTPEMRTGNSLMGSVESGIGAAAFVRLAKFYDLPVLTASGVDSKIPDAQAAIERLVTTMPAMLAGADLIHHITIDTELTASYEQMVIDDEIFGMMERFLSGIEVTDETLAVDLIKEVGPGGAYIGRRHTLNHFEKEHYIPRIFYRKSYDSWYHSGSKDIRQRAKEKVQEILEKHQPEPLEKTTQEKIAQIIKKAEKDSRSPNLL
jgi:trimethylamine--corrinoid protein Co-methyltransferase